MDILQGIQALFPEYTVTSEKITGADMLYTDGLASSSDLKFVFRKTHIEYTAFIQGKEVMGFPHQKEIYDRLLRFLPFIQIPPGHFVEPLLQ
jgi:hypothetical protein